MAGSLVGTQLYLSLRFGLYGVYPGTDAGVYVQIAEVYASGIAWGHLPPALLHANIPLFRLPGYPLLLLGSMECFGRFWVAAICALQMAAAIGAGFVLYRTAAAISGLRLVGGFAAAIWMASERAVWDRFILTDSLETSLLTIGVCWLALLAFRVKAARVSQIVGIGLIFALSQLLRELTLVVALSAVPLSTMAIGFRQSISRTLNRLLAVFIPIAGVLVIMLAWNYERTGGDIVLSTGAGTALLLPLVEAQREGGSMFSGNYALDRPSRTRLRDYSFKEVMEISSALTGEDNLAVVAASQEVTRAYVAGWLKHPVLMVRLA